MTSNLEWIGKRVRGKSGAGYVGVYVVKGVTTSGLAYCELARVPSHIRAIQIEDLELVEDEPAPAPAQEVSDGG